jgi:hypothetical protein
VSWLRDALGLAGALLVAYAAWPYVREIRARDEHAHPRLVSWAVWAETTAVATVAELIHRSVAAGLLTGACALSCLAVLAAGRRWGDGRPLGPLDWWCLALAQGGVALLALAVWRPALWPWWLAVGIAVITDFLAYLPTYRNGAAGQEPVRPYALNFAGSSLSAAAAISLAGLLFTGYLVLANGAMTVIAGSASRRRRHRDLRHSAARDCGNLDT